MPEKIIKQKIEQKHAEEESILQEHPKRESYSRKVEELHERTGMAENKLQSLFSFCKEMDIPLSTFAFITGCVGSGVNDRKGNVDAVIKRKKEEMNKLFDSSNFTVFEKSGTIVRTDWSSENKPWVITDYEKVKELAEGPNNHEYNWVRFDVAEKFPGQKISIFEIREDLLEKTQWFAYQNAPTYQYQPFPLILLINSQPLTDEARELVQQLSTKFDKKQVADAYFAIAGQLLNANYPDLGERRVPVFYNPKIDISFNKWISRGEEFSDKAAKTVFRAVGDYLPRALYIMITNEWPSGKSVKEMEDIIDEKLPGIGMELRRLRDDSTKLHENPDFAKTLKLREKTIDTYREIYNTLHEKFDLDLETMNKNAKEFDENIIRPKHNGD